MIRILSLITTLLLPVAPAAAGTRVETPTGRVETCLPSDGHGLLAATRGGLVERDRAGKTRRIWTAMNGLPGTRTWTIAAIGGETWVGTERGVARFKRSPSGLVLHATHRSAPVRAILAHQGVVYLGTWGGGVLRRVGAAADFKRLPLVGKPATGPERRVTSLAIHAGRLHVGTAGGGIQALTGDTLRRALPGLKGRWVWSLASHRGRLWAGTFGGLVSIGPQGLTAEASIDVRALRRVGSRLVGASASSGVWTLKPGDVRRATRFEGAPNQVAGFGAQDGALCVATAKGLWTRRGAGPWVHALAPRLPDGDIAAIAHAGGRLWVGLFDHGLMRLQGGQWREVGAGQIDRKVNAIATAKAGAVWVGTARGLHRIIANRIHTFTTRDGLPSNDIHALTVLRSGDVLVGTAAGAAVVSGGRVKTFGKKQGLDIAAVWSVAEGPGGRLLLGTSRGLFIGDGARPWRRLSVASGHLRADWITALAVKGRRVWVGTYNSGVTRLTFRGRSIRRVHLGGGWVNLAGVTLHGDRLLVSTMTGLRTRPAYRSGRWRKIRHAAPGRDVTGTVVTPTGIWVASRRGLAWRPTGEGRAALASQRARGATVRK